MCVCVCNVKPESQTASGKTRNKIRSDGKTMRNTDLSCENVNSLLRHLSVSMIMLSPANNTIMQLICPVLADSGIRNSWLNFLTKLFIVID